MIFNRLATVKQGSCSRYSIKLDQLEIYHKNKFRYSVVFYN